MTDHDKAREYCWESNFHDCGDFRVTLGHGGTLELDAVLADYAAEQTRAKDERIRVLEEALRRHALVASPSGQGFLRCLECGETVLVGAEHHKQTCLLAGAPPQAETPGEQKEGG